MHILTDNKDMFLKTVTRWFMDVVGKLKIVISCWCNSKRAMKCFFTTHIFYLKRNLKSFNENVIWIWKLRHLWNSSKAQKISWINPQEMKQKKNAFNVSFFGTMSSRKLYTRCQSTFQVVLLRMILWTLCDI